MTTICLINQKGGCGKSSAGFHLAGALARDGLNVLLADADPQDSLSQGFFGSATVETLPLPETLAALFDESAYFLDRSELILPTPFPGISVCPTNQYLATFNVPDPQTCGLLQFALRDFPSSRAKSFLKTVSLG